MAAGSGKRVLVCGYYGEHNLGDDALLMAVLDQLPSGWVPLVTAHDQQQVRNRCGVATVDRRSPLAVLRALGECDALVLGGGSLLQDATSLSSLLYYLALISAARLQGKTVVLWGQGLGPLRRRRSRTLVRLALGQGQACSWRDRQSAAMAAGWGLRGHLGSDPVWAVPRRPWHGSGGPIVLCWRPVPQLQGEDWRPYMEALEQLARAADRPVLWLPFHQVQDRGLLARLRAEGLVSAELLARSEERQVATPEEAMELFATAGLVVAMRLHGLILAALSGSPCGALSYDPKVAAAAQELDCACTDLLQPAPRAADLANGWRALLDQPLPAAVIQRQVDGTAIHRQLLREALRP